MSIVILSKPNILTKGLRQYTRLKVSNLEKYLEGNAEIKVEIGLNKEVYKVEATIRLDNSVVIRTQEKEYDIYCLIDIVCEKLEEQIIRYLKKIKAKKINELNNEKEIYEEEFSDDIESEAVINRYKKFLLKPMSIEEAVLQMDLLGHNFYMFKSEKDYKINVVYKRNEGGYGIIEEI